MSKAKATAAGGAAVVLLLAATLIKPWEGVRYTPYQDVVGVWTVCYGSTTNVDPSRKYTKAECDARLKADMQEADNAVQRCVGREMPDGVRAALISLTFNVGPKPVCSGSPGKFARAGDWPNTCKSLELYRMAGGRVFRGLVLRRADERKVCEQGLTDSENNRR